MDRSKLPPMSKKSKVISAGNKAKPANKKTTYSGSYSKKRRAGYEDMLKEAGK